MAISAVTLVEDSAVNTASTTATATQFALSGSFDRYNPKTKMIIVDGIEYKLQVNNPQTVVDLSRGQQIKFNIEKSASDNPTRITKVWQEIKEP